jgi:plastocyanin
MNRKAVLTAGALVSLVLTALPFPSRAEEKENEHLRANLNVIRIERSDVFPETAEVKASEAVAWTNYSGTSVEIRFNKETVKQLQCTEQSPLQMIEDDAVFSSGEIRSSEVVTLCQFAPGEYEYTVRRRHSPSFPRGGTTSSMGKISVSQ